MSPRAATVERRAGPVMDPRLRARRTAVIRQQGRRRLRIAVAVALVVSLGAGAWGLLHTPFFSARHVSVRGASHTPRAQVLQVAGLQGHPPLVDVSASGASARLARLPWVLSARVVVRWPDSVAVTILERRPVAVVDGVDRSGRPGVEVDGTGRVLGPASSDATLPTLVSPARPGPPGSELGPAAQAGLVVAAGLPPALTGRVEQITVDRDGQITLGLGGGLTAFLGSSDGLPPKFESLAAVLAGADPTGPAVIDVSQPGEPTVTSTPAPTSAQTTSDAQGP